MKINTFLYTIKQGFLNIFRNKIFSLASIATMSACIFMFGIFYILLTNFSAMVRDAQESVSVTVFFDQEMSGEDIYNLGKTLESEKPSMVRSAKYVSAEEAWENFKEVYFEGNEEYAESFGKDNPLANSASLQIYVTDVSIQDNLVEYIEKLEGVREVKQAEVVAKTLSDINLLIGYVSAGIIAILLGVAIFLINNTVSTGISVRKEEISIMKLIGATDFLVRAPFVIEGMIIGFMGALIPLILLFVIYDRIMAYIETKFNIIGGMLQFIPAAEVFNVLIPASLALGVGIGFIGSRLTIRKHLKV